MLGFGKKKEEEDVPQIIVDEDDVAAFEAWLVENGVPRLGYERTKPEEYYCGLCGCLQPITHFPH